MTTMRRAVPMLLLLALAAGAVPASSAVQPTGFAFGRLGGNIRPYTVTIANSGAVRTSGAVVVGRRKLTSLQLGGLNRVATETSFVTLPMATNCRGTLPDVASTYIRVGARTVRVHGSCLPRYQRLLKALQASVRIAT
jgi:hypothetical protein